MAEDGESSLFNEIVRLASILPVPGEKIRITEVSLVDIDRKIWSFISIVTGSGYGPFAAVNRPSQAVVVCGTFQRDGLDSFKEDRFE